MGNRKCPRPPRRQVWLVVDAYGRPTISVFRLKRNALMSAAALNRMAEGPNGGPPGPGDLHYVAGPYVLAERARQR